MAKFMVSREDINTNTEECDIITNSTDIKGICKRNAMKKFGPSGL